MKYLVLIVLGVALITAGVIFSKDRDAIAVRATLIYDPIENGCWTAIAIDPLPLGKLQLIGDIVREFPRDTAPGRKIMLYGRIRSDLATTCMNGTPFEVIGYKFRE